jgi:hypothetical protein
MHCVLFGRFVQPGDTESALVRAAASEPARSLAVHAPKLPRPIAQVLDRALAFDKRDRWTSAHEMRSALRLAGEKVRYVATAHRDVRTMKCFGSMTRLHVVADLERTARLADRRRASATRIACVDAQQMHAEARVRLLVDPI